jgi:hypothetical protein
MTRSATDRLLRAEENGAIIVCACAPYENWEMTYAPRHERDPQPWVIAGAFRYSGSECKAMTREDLKALEEGE